VKDFQTTNVLGISEVCMARMVNGQAVKVITCVGLYCELCEILGSHGSEYKDDLSSGMLHLVV
jgi:hypothetical protein